MNSQMSSEITTFGERTVALVAFVGFFASMSPHMNFQSTRSHELIIAGLTDIGALARVSSLVVGQVSLRCEMHITICKVAFKRSLTIMDPHMCE